MIIRLPRQEHISNPVTLQNFMRSCFSTLSSVRSFTSKIPVDLIEANLILRHGIFHANRQRASRLDRRFALHHAHHAIELVLRKKAGDLGASAPAVYDFPKLIRFLKKNNVTMTYQRELEALNKNRELIQHYGQVPDEREAYSLVSTSENFMKDFCANAFGTDYRKISVLENIENDDIKGTMHEAQTALETGKFDDAAVMAHLAIAKTKWLVQEKTMPQRIVNLWSSAEVQKAGLEYIIAAIRLQMDEILDVTLSATFAGDLNRLASITRAAFIRILGGSPQVSSL